MMAFSPFPSKIMTRIRVLRVSVKKKHLYLPCAYNVQTISHPNCNRIVTATGPIPAPGLHRRKQNCYEIRILYLEFTTQGQPNYSIAHAHHPVLDSDSLSAEGNKEKGREFMVTGGVGWSLVLQVRCLLYNTWWSNSPRFGVTNLWGEYHCELVIGADQG